jgi:hypothetical protein
VRVGLLVVGLGLVACASLDGTAAPVAIALDPQGERLFVAEDGELWSLSLSPRQGLARSQPQPLAGPCAAHLDLEIWQGELFALCPDGRAFAMDVPIEGSSSDWRELPSQGHALVALQPSDAMLLGVTADGQLHALASHLAARGAIPHAASLGLSAEGGVAETRSTPGTTSFRLLALDENPGARRRDGLHHGLLEISAEHLATLDRFRGPDRGGPGQLPVASFVAYEPLAAHALVLRRGPEVVVSAPRAMLTCSIWAPGAVVSDLALPAYDHAVAATIVEPGGRTLVFYAHRNGTGPAFAGVFDPRGGRRLRPRVRCDQF